MFSHIALDPSPNATSAVLLAGGYPAIPQRTGRPSIPCRIPCSRSSVIALLAPPQLRHNRTVAHASVTIRLSPFFVSPPK
jgi:hypothetical protein